jgi:hypothetical protein
MAMVPEAWQNDQTMTEEKKAYYTWSAYAMEPWDGPGIITTNFLINERKTEGAINPETLTTLGIQDKTNKTIKKFNTTQKLKNISNTDPH